MSSLGRARGGDRFEEARKARERRQLQRQFDVPKVRRHSSFRLPTFSHQLCDNGRCATQMLTCHLLHEAHHASSVAGRLQRCARNARTHAGQRTRHDQTSTPSTRFLSLTA